MARIRHDDINTCVHGAIDRRLPTTAGEARHGDAVRVGVGVVEQHIECAFQRIVEERDSADADEIKAGEPLLDIVPSGVELIVDARVRPTDIDRIFQGMRARIVLSAYKQRNMPLIHGTVHSVSADSLRDDRSGDPYFLARVKVEPGIIETIPDVVLTPGMPVEVMLLDQEQTLAAYLVDPLRQSVARSFLED